MYKGNKFVRYTPKFVAGQQQEVFKGLLRNQEERW
jgi:hypothetical protein